MSAEPERLFSSTGYMLNDRRNRLQIETIEAIECLKSWYKLKGNDEIQVDIEV